MKLIDSFKLIDAFINIAKIICE